MAVADLIQTVRSTLGVLAVDVQEQNGQVLAYVPAKMIRDALMALRDGEGSRCDILTYMTAVDYSPHEPRFEIVYDLYSVALKHRIRIKCKLDDTSTEELPAITTVSDIYLAANWHERECYDLMGIMFTDHPDLRRIMLPDRWDGHPLRKEYPYDGKAAWELGTTVIDGATMEGDLGL